MATCSLVLTGQTIGTLEAPFSIEDADATRILQYAMTAHPIKVNGVTDPSESMKEVPAL